MREGLFSLDSRREQALCVSYALAKQQPARAFFMEMAASLRLSL